MFDHTLPLCTTACTPCLPALSLPPRNTRAVDPTCAHACPTVEHISPYQWPVGCGCPPERGPTTSLRRATTPPTQMSPQACNPCTNATVHAHRTRSCPRGRSSCRATTCTRSIGGGCRHGGVTAQRGQRTGSIWPSTRQTVSRRVRSRSSRVMAASVHNARQTAVPCADLGGSKSLTGDLVCCGRQLRCECPNASHTVCCQLMRGHAHSTRQSQHGFRHITHIMRRLEGRTASPVLQRNAAAVCSRVCMLMWRHAGGGTAFMHALGASQMAWLRISHTDLCVSVSLRE